MRKNSLLDHNSVPKHEIINEDEIKSVLDKYQIERGQFPKIKEEDPVADELEASAGDIIKITRISQTAGESFYYRLVVE